LFDWVSVLLIFCFINLVITLIYEVLFELNVYFNFRLHFESRSQHKVGDEID
jgi:hypothetical protein